MLGLIAGCKEVTGPTRRVGPPYLAALVKFDTPSPSVIGSVYRYRVRELSGTVGFDTTIAVHPTDTVIVPVVPATYAIRLTGVPPQCHLRGSTDQMVVVPEKSNTSLARFFIRCETQVTVTLTTTGYQPDIKLLYALTSTDGHQRTGIVGGSDTLLFNGIGAGPATFDLASVPENCEVTSDGGVRQALQVDSTAGTSLSFRLSCSDPAHRPRLVGFHSSYHDGSAAVFFRVIDPDGDIDRYYWDITNCRRKSLLVGGARLRGPLGTPWTTGRDTVIIVGGFDVGLPDDSVRGKCAVLWAADQSGNTTTISQVDLGGSGHPPVATAFNGRFVGTGLLRTDLGVSDPDGDFAGVFATFRVREGVFGPASSTTNVLLYNASGIPAGAVPDIPMQGPPFVYDNFYGITVFLIDSAGNFTRLQDDDLFQ
jgi:hypothetical protein